jgi:hypothetical protein
MVKFPVTAAPTRVSQSDRGALGEGEVEPAGTRVAGRGPGQAAEGRTVVRCLWPSSSGSHRGAPLLEVALPSVLSFPLGQLSSAQPVPAVHCGRPGDLGFRLAYVHEEPLLVAW